MARTVVNVRPATSSRLAYRGGPRSRSGSLATLAAMRRASSRVSGRMHHRPRQRRRGPSTRACRSRAQLSSSTSRAFVASPAHHFW